MRRWRMGAFAGAVVLSLGIAGCQQQDSDPGDTSPTIDFDGGSPGMTEDATPGMTDASPDMTDTGMSPAPTTSP